MGLCGSVFRMRISRALGLVLLGSTLSGCGGSGEPVSAPSDAASAPVKAAAHADAAPAPTTAQHVDADRPVLDQELAYGEGARSNLVGYLAMPADAIEPLPAIIVIHDWSGLNDTIKAVTRRLASEGYVALAVDLYGGVTASTPEAAQPLMATLAGEPEAARANLRQAYDYLEKYAFAPRIAAIGWGLGGGWSLQTALLYPSQLDAVVMYYGQVMTDRERLAPLAMPILGFFGGEDRSVPVREVQAFRATLMDLGKKSEVLILPRMNQAFANPSSGTYDEVAANEAWATTLAFLDRNLKLGAPTPR